MSTDNSIAYGRERHCDEDHDGSHWHCSRCGAVCSSEGHEPSMCELARKRDKDRPGFARAERSGKPPMPPRQIAVLLAELEAAVRCEERAVTMHERQEADFHTEDVRLQLRAALAGAMTSRADS